MNGNLAGRPGSAVPDKFEDISTYLAVLDCGGVNAAAAELGIAKSAASRRLSDLERRLGVTLIDRSTRRFEPTAMGVEYASRARAILKSLEDLDTSVGPGDGRGTVTIRADRAIIAHRILPALAAIGADARSLTVRLIDDADAAADEMWDIRIGVGPVAASTRALFSTETILCASPGYVEEYEGPAGQRRLEGQRTVGFGDGRSPPYDITAPDADAAAAAAIAGLGIARLPDYVVAAALADGSLMRLPDGRETGDDQVVAWCSDDATPTARRLVDALAAALG